MKNCKLLKDDIIKYYGKESFDELVRSGMCDTITSVQDPVNPYHVIVLPEDDYCDWQCHLCKAYGKKCLHDKSEEPRFNTDNVNCMMNRQMKCDLCGLCPDEVIEMRSLYEDPGDLKETTINGKTYDELDIGHIYNLIDEAIFWFDSIKEHMESGEDLDLICSFAEDGEEPLQIIKDLILIATGIESQTDKWRAIREELEEGGE